MPKIDTDVYNFVTFMKGHYKKSGESMTHTLMGPLHKDLAPGKGAFSIEGVEYETFMNLYQLALPKMQMHIVERPKNVGPMVIDIDFKTHKADGDRKYLDLHIEAIIKIYNDLFKKYLDINYNQIKAFVFEKPKPTYVEKDKQWKDGFHILYPEIPIDVKKRYFFFDKAQQIIIDNDIFEDIPFVNTYKEILDSSVIKSNGMLMYGSSKEGREPYNLSKIYTHDLEIEKIDEYDEDDLPNYFSIRRYCDEDDINLVTNKNNNKNKKSNVNYGSDNDSNYDYENESADEVDSDNQSELENESVDSDSENDLQNAVNEAFDKYDTSKPKLKRKQSYQEMPDDFDGYCSGPEIHDEKPNKLKQNQRNNLHGNETLGRTDQFPSQYQVLGKQFEIEISREILKIFKRSRYDDYNEWIRVGWALHGVSPTLLPDFIAFSKKSKKFVKGECEKIWRNADEFGGSQLGVGTLQWWAREDNLEAYLQILRKAMNPLINEAKSGTHDDIANVMKEMYKHMYKCVSIQKNIWYEFQGSAWVALDSAYTLKERIPSEVVKEFFVLHSSHIASASGTVAVDQDEHIKQSGKIQKLYEKLKNNGFQKQVIESCTAKFYDKKFEETLNTNPMLIGFKNGVYDLEKMCFRKGTPDDLISMTTGYDYKEYSMDSPEVKKVEKYFAQIQRQEDVRTYVLRLIASFLDGRVKDQKFVLWTGHGCHAKDQEILMYDGSKKKIQDIKIKDNVMGPDGRPRRVVATYNGEANMYTIHVEDKDNTKFTITPNHRLALRSHFKPIIDTSYDDIYDVTLYWVTYHLMTDDGPVKLKEKFYDEQSAKEFIDILEGKEDFIEYGRVIPLNVHTYSQIPYNVAKFYKLYKTNTNQDQDSEFNLQLHKDRQEYFGIELDGDKKYIMDNGYVTYNSNGKSTTISLIHDTLGDYSGTLASQVVTRKRGGAGQATPDLADKMGKRFLAIQEPDPDDQIYVGQMKELSAGNDKIAARALYGNPFYYKPQFKMVLCCNKLPHIPSNDGGTWRRLRVTPWESQFVDLNYPKDKMEPHQFYKDPKLDDDMKRWPQPFMWLLLNKYYPDYIKNGLGEPEKVLQFTNKYKKDSDVYLEYLSQWTEDPGDPEYEEPLAVLYRMFKLWYKEAYATAVPPQKEFSSYLENKFVVEKGKVKGIKLKIGD